MEPLVIIEKAGAAVPLAVGPDFAAIASTAEDEGQPADVGAEGMKATGAVKEATDDLNTAWRKREEEGGEEEHEEHEEQEGETAMVELGFVDDCELHLLRSPHFPSKVGGKPVSARSRLLIPSVSLLFSAY